MFAEKPAHKGIHSRGVSHDIFRDNQDIREQWVKESLDWLFVKILVAILQRLDANIDNLGFLEIVVLQNKVKLLDDMLGIYVVV